jgi:branched-chain amino acid transport system ATP-binding protein
MSLSAEIADKPRPLRFGEITPIATAPSCDIVLRASSLGLSFGAVDALRDVSIAVAAGEIHAIIGPNGAGKSSLLNCLSGFYRPQRGRVMFEDRDITALSPHRRAAIGIGRTFQGIQTYPSMTVRENILTGYHPRARTGMFDALVYWGRVRTEEEALTRKAEAIIEFLELEELRQATVGDLSYGLRKRVEPMAGMNPEEKGDLARFILDIRDARKIPIVLVEHDMEVVMDISDTVTVLDFGKVIASGPPDQVRADPVVISAYLGVG